MFTEIKDNEESFRNRAGLEKRVLGGEVVVARKALQAYDCMALLEDAALRGIEKSQGANVAAQAAEEGFHRIHEWVVAADIPAMTDAVYDEIRPLAAVFLRQFIPGMFPGITSYFYEKTPNVRFHIPYDIAAAHQKAYNQFGKNRGQGKITAHGPHRDSWLDCPSNGINLWFAIGRIRPGNGLTVYNQDYNTNASYQKSGNISDGEKLHRALSFDLYPGDAVIFHTDHVHGSELNRLQETRFAVSFRVSIEKPRFENLHYHHYVYSDLESYSKLSQVPALAQLSYVRSLITRSINKVIPDKKAQQKKSQPPENIGASNGDTIRLPLSEVPVGQVRGISAALCVARLDEYEFVAMTRRCPHQGGDFANGWVDNKQIVCPWHNLPFCSETGRSNCSSLPALKMVRSERIDDEIVVYRKERIEARSSSQI